MYSFYKSMALFWTFAEGLILIYMRWGFLFVKRGHGRQPVFLIFSLFMFAFLSFVIFEGEPLFNRFMDLQRGTNLVTYRWGLWNFFCTLWVILEGLIMIYVFRIYRTLKLHIGGIESVRKTGKRGAGRTNYSYGIPLLIFLLPALYIFYEYCLLYVIEIHSLSAVNIYRISVFYIRICGMFWICFEWIVAFIGISAYFLLKRAEAPFK